MQFVELVLGVSEKIVSALPCMEHGEYHRFFFGGNLHTFFPNSRNETVRVLVVVKRVEKMRLQGPTAV